MIKKSLFLLFFLTSSLANAQDMFQEYLFSADIVMKNRDKISLTDAQADKIKKIHSTNAADFSTLKWDLDAETAKLKKLLALTKPDPAAVTKQMDLVLNLENQLKKKQLSTLVAIKNELTENQINDLSKTKVLGRVTSWEYAPGGASPTLGATDPKYRIGKDLYGTNPEGKGAGGTSVNGTTEVTSTSPKVAVTVNGKGKQPLYFISSKSGLFKVNSLDDIDPKVIESVTVLKGEQALEKFGPHGINGVVVIKLINGKDEQPLEN